MTIHLSTGIFGQDEIMSIDLKWTAPLGENNVILSITSWNQVLSTQTVRFGVGEESKTVKVQVSQLKFNGGVISINLYDVKKQENQD